MDALPRRSPNEFLKLIIGKPVVVRLTSGVDYRGAWFAACGTQSRAHVWACKHMWACARTGAHWRPQHSASRHMRGGVSRYMNIALEQTEEIVNGQVKNVYGDAFIRGNNGACASSRSRAGRSGAGTEPRRAAVALRARSVPRPPVLYISMKR